MRKPSEETLQADVFKLYFEQTKTLFLNYMHEKFRISYDHIMFLYLQIWKEIRNKLVLEEMPEGVHWRLYILSEGYRRAYYKGLRLDKRSFINHPGFSYSRKEDRKYSDGGFLTYSARKVGPLEDVLADADFYHMLMDELTHLPEPDRAILMLRFYDDVPMEDVVEMVNVGYHDFFTDCQYDFYEKLSKRLENRARSLGLIHGREWHDLWQYIPGIVVQGFRELGSQQDAELDEILVSMKPDVFQGILDQQGYAALSSQFKDQEEPEPAKREVHEKEPQKAPGKEPERPGVHRNKVKSEQEQMRENMKSIDELLKQSKAEKVFLWIMLGVFVAMLCGMAVILWPK